ncbi:hypothetical protein IQ270_16200 [Microcoleus sp. LEGE 07076]|uniref:hypothetical protein n=1 Tax=Microcoleus sp. LEGE 07076 TaxID=915322 RepID=UPI0019F6E65F|nr:hypothetical protein [Microcoleus sp. LEGE 07076]MBE9186185.1 hypothetical protein [Microcoleus sp. LEGE 07076]
MRLRVRLRCTLTVLGYSAIVSGLLNGGILPRAKHSQPIHSLMVNAAAGQLH